MGSPLRGESGVLRAQKTSSFFVGYRLETSRGERGRDAHRHRAREARAVPRAAAWRVCERDVAQRKLADEKGARRSEVARRMGAQHVHVAEGDA